MSIAAPTRTPADPGTAPVSDPVTDPGTDPGTDPDIGLGTDPEAESGLAPVRGWSALGTYVHLQTAGGHRLDEAAQLAAAVLDEVDRTCSRFRPDSDLMLANARAGEWTQVSPVLVGAVRVAIEAAEATDGLVDPTLGHHLLTAGYDRTFALLTESSTHPAAVPIPPARDRWRQVEVREDALRLPIAAYLDLGATGKAYAADLVAASIVTQLGVAVVVSVGGDVRAEAPADATTSLPAWPIGIAHTAAALDDGPDEVIELVDGGLATSSTAARRWVRGGREWHHLIDPRTGEPARGPWRTVTAIGHTAVAANTASTAAIVLGATAPAWLSAHGVAARLVDHDDCVTTTPGWPVADVHSKGDTP